MYIYIYTYIYIYICVYIYIYVYVHAYKHIIIHAHMTLYCYVTILYDVMLCFIISSRAGRPLSAPAPAGKASPEMITITDINYYGYRDFIKLYYTHFRGTLIKHIVCYVIL